jgi:H/ACA ribonucleoprotein complex subunit 1
MHDAEGELLCRLTNSMIPYFNAGIYLENKSKIGKVEEVLGPVNRVMFTVKPDSGVHASSFKPDDKFFVGTDKLLPFSRFTGDSKPAKRAPGGPGGRGRGPPGRGAPGGRGRGPPGRAGGAFRGVGFRGGGRGR